MVLCPAKAGPDPIPHVPRTDHETLARSKDETITAKNDLIATLHHQIETREKEIGRIQREDATRHAAKITSLQNQIAELWARLANPDQAKEDLEIVEADISRRLDREANHLNADKVAAAKAAMEAAQFSKADALFSEIEDQETLAIESAARAAFARGEIAEAEVRWEDSAAHYARAVGLQPSVDALLKACVFAKRAGQFDRALDFGQRLIALLEKDTEAPDSTRAESLNLYASTLKDAGRYAEAEPLYREALKITRATLGTGHPDYATYLNNLAALLQATGRSDEAEPLYREVLKIDRVTLGTGHPDHAAPQQPRRSA